MQETVANETHRKRKRNMKKKYSRLEGTVRYFFPSFFIFFAVSLVICLLDQKCGWTGMIFSDAEDARETLSDLFLTQVQITFVVVTLSTALSQTSRKVYWEDCFQYRLISPPLINFTAISSYILSILLVGAIWKFAGRVHPEFEASMGVLFSFVLSVLLMILLSIRMIDANFGREKIKEELKEELQRKLQKDGDAITHIGHDIGLRIPEIGKLEYITFKEIDERELPEICENLFLLVDLDLKATVNKILKYVEEEISPQEAADEIYYALIRRFTEKNDDRIFYYGYGVPFERIVKSLKGIEDDMFREARKLAHDGHMDEALQKRSDFYGLLTKAMAYHGRSIIDCGAGDGNAYYAKMMNLISGFVIQRENEIYAYDENGHPVVLPGAWHTCEYESIKDEEVLENRKYLLSLIDRIKDEYLDKDEDELFDEIGITFEDFMYADKF